MGPYSSFEACVRANQDKRNPEAYCGQIYWVTEGKNKLKKSPKKSKRK